MDAISFGRYILPSFKRTKKANVITKMDRRKKNLKKNNKIWKDNVEHISWFHVKKKTIDDWKGEGKKIASIFLIPWLRYSVLSMGCPLNPSVNWIKFIAIPMLDVYCYIKNTFAFNISLSQFNIQWQIWNWNRWNIECKDKQYMHYTFGICDRC